MDFALCFSRNHLSWIVLLGPLLILASILSYGFSAMLLISTVLILSSIIFTFSNRKQRSEDESSKDEILRADQEISAHIECAATNQAGRPESECIRQKDDVRVEDDRSEVGDDCLAKPSPVVLSESDGLASSSTSEESEVEWSFQDNVLHSTDWSDGSMSDEEGLIEIALTSGGHYAGDKQEDPKLQVQKKLPDFAPAAFLKQQYGLTELLAELNEMNEEENLIEIDIFMGSIKCPRFGIEA
ncbi:hypothetical protein K2173_000564 [Erythroxylum novogranatense]|uniref:Uncharacterized protein n=1 Tax=Erythroxylum novogranatense TaxID=1862640 RepID=A0AAV8S7Z0_9ROSI|nr:hypothetical protein K2173_000564 [Erythroxylum novogranatense]